MRYIILITAAFCIFSAEAQKNQSIGIGYFGETLTYPGIVIEYDYESNQSEKAALVFKSDLGYYNHPRNHQAIFLDQHIGLRRNIGKRMFMEHYLGVGVMLPILNAPVYKVNENGAVEESSKIMNPDFMPSVTLGLGYDFDSTQDRNAVWIRPKMFWQYPYNTLALPHLAVQVGFTHTFKTISK